MKNLIYLSLFSLLIFGCSKKESNSADKACEESYAPLSIGVYASGPVRHPIPSNIYIANGETTFFPEIIGDNVFYNDFVLTIDGGDPLTYTPGYGAVILEDGLSVGTHTATMSLSCTKELYVDNQPVYCDCRDEELYASEEFEFIEPTYIRIDSLIFNQNLNCDGVNGSFCPDVYFDWKYYDIPRYITYNYYYSEDAPIEIAYGDTIAIYPQACTIPINIFDRDQFNDDDYLGNAEMNPTNMDGWTTGSHEIETNFWVVITRLN